MTRLPSDEVTSAVRAKRCVFTLTAGRSGSNFLQQLFALLPGTRSEHEPEPDFVHVLRRAQHNPEAAQRFWLDVKLPHIAKLPEKRYVETSHLFCKGFVESLLRCGIVPDAVVLRRPPRQIAASLFGIQTIPARTSAGLMYLLSPADPFVMPLPQWELLSDYQLCFWYALEIERRQRRYAAMLRQAGGTVEEVTLRDLGGFSRFVSLAGALGFAVSEAGADLERRFDECRAVRHNPKGKKELSATDVEFAAAEEPVWERIAWYEPLLRAKVERQYV